MAAPKDKDRKIPNRINKDFRYDIAVLRLFCIAIVVFFHAYGMMYAKHFSDQTRMLYAQKYEFFNTTFCINVAMPMFVFISGFLFGGQLLKKQAVTFKKLLKSKVMRLLIPFFVFTVIFMFTQNAVSWKPFYQWTYSHLWFLPMLFWCFIITYFLRPLILSPKYLVSVSIIVGLLLISTFGKLFPPFLGLHGVNMWIGWFGLGMWFCKHENVLTLPNISLIYKCEIIVGCIATFIILMILFPQEYGKSTIPGILATVSGIYGLWILFTWIPCKNFAVTDFLVALSACSFGIYIFHNWLEAHMISQTAQRLLPLESWAQNHYILFPFIFSTLAFLISLGITWMLLKFKIGRKLLG